MSTLTLSPYAILPSATKSRRILRISSREVKLPGKDSRSPQSFPFGTPYVEIRDFLARQNEALFRRNSVLGLLERDAATKRAPERWQALESEEVASFDVVVCFESRVFDLVVEGTLWYCCRSRRCCSSYVPFLCPTWIGCRYMKVDDEVRDSVSCGPWEIAPIDPPCVLRAKRWILYGRGGGRLRELSWRWDTCASRDTLPADEIGRSTTWQMKIILSIIPINCRSLLVVRPYPCSHVFSPQRLHEPMRITTPAPGPVDLLRFLSATQTHTSCGLFACQCYIGFRLSRWMSYHQ